MHFGTINIYILVYLLSKINGKELLNKTQNIVLSILTIILLITNTVFSSVFKYMNIIQIIILSIIFYIAIYNLLNINKEKNRKIFCNMTILIALLTGLFVNPVIKGVGVIDERPLSLEIQKIVSKEPDAVWAVNDLTWLASNFVVANGARTITSTNVYPNIDLYENLLGENATYNEEIYNRYHHITLKIVNEETSIKLKETDSVEILLNYNDLSKLDVDYILTRKNLKIEYPEIKNIEEYKIIGKDIIYKVIK